MHKNYCQIKAMNKIEEVTCIKFQEKSENNHQELVLHNGVPIIMSIMMVNESHLITHYRN